jgi:hypothetical protein
MAAGDEKLADPFIERNASIPVRNDAAKGSGQRKPARRVGKSRQQGRRNVRAARQGSVAFCRRAKAIARRLSWTKSANSAMESLLMRGTQSPYCQVTQKVTQRAVQPLFSRQR